MPRRIVKVVVYTHHDVKRALLHWRGHDDFLHAGPEEEFQLFFRSELPAGFQHDVHAQVSPRHVSEILLAAVCDGLAVDDELVLLTANFAVPAPVQRVEIQQMRGGCAIPADFIEVDELDVRPVPARAKGEPAHASESVDADACCHSCWLHIRVCEYAGNKKSLARTAPARLPQFRGTRRVLLNRWHFVETFREALQQFFLKRISRRS